MLSSDKLSFFHELVSLNKNVYLWEYSNEFQLVYSTCPSRESIDPFREIGISDIIVSTLSDADAPMIITFRLGFVWIVTADHRQDSVERYYALGPFLLDDNHYVLIDKAFSRLGMDTSMHINFSEIIRELPVMGLTRILEYGQMMQYCVSGGKTEISDFIYWDEDKGSTDTNSASESTDMHGTWAAEQRFLKMVREGNLHYKDAANSLAVTGRPGSLGNGHPGRQLKNLIITSIVLCSRAAMEGGLSSEIAYSLSDHYFQSVEACRSISELASINETMVEDYVQRVHKARLASAEGRSVSILECCDYISLHIDDKLTVHDVAAFANYTDFYFGRKFKDEMGVSAKEYITCRKIERAQELLAGTKLSINEISEALGFSSHSYFTEQFRKRVGRTPTEYRNSPVPDVPTSGIE